MTRRLVCILTAGAALAMGGITANACPPAGWPTAATTGVPDGVTLTPWTGSCTVSTPNTVIDAKTINCVRLDIQTSGVKITRSRVNGRVEVRPPVEGKSFTISDSEVFVGDELNTGLQRANFTATRVEVVGGRRSAYCETNCTIEDSWVHGQSVDPDGAAHFSGIRMSQFTILKHNTITCEAGRGPDTGCSAGLTGYGDFAPVTDNLIEGNLFLGGQNDDGTGGSSFCAFGGSTAGKPYSSGAARIRFINNVFVKGITGKCGNLNAVSAFDHNAPGNVWQGNTWDDGSVLTP